MPHLTPETLARLADEPATAPESDHLNRCADCRGELAAFRRQAAALRTLPPSRPAAGDWARLERALRSEGLARQPRSRLPALSRVAAAIAIFALGALAGSWWSAGPEMSASAPEYGVEAASEAEGSAPDLLRDYAASVDPADGDPLARLAALEAILITTGAVLSEAPADPVINGYHLSAREARDAVLHRLTGHDGSTEWF